MKTALAIFKIRYKKILKQYLDDLRELKVQINHGDKVQSGKWVTITVEDDPKMIGKGLSTADEAKVKAFIKQNKDGLLKVWQDEIDPVDFATEHLRKLKK